MVSTSPRRSTWTLADGRPADARAFDRRPRLRTLRGLARQADLGTFAGLARTLDARQAACGCGDALTPPDTWSSSADLVLPTGWEWRGAEPVKLDLGLGTVDPTEEVVTGSAAAFRFGLNTPNLFEAEKGKEGRYGPAAQILEDLGSLGVQVARHPGRLQLMLDEVLTGGRGELSVALLDEDTMRSTIEDSEAMGGLLRLATKLAALDLDCTFILTLVTLGGGSATAAYSDGEHVNPSLVTWADDFKDQVIVDDRTVDSGSPRAYPFHRLPLEGDGTLSDWDRQTLDPANPFKRLFCRQFARLVGEWLERHAEELGPYLEGIEIGNELDMRNVRQETVGSKTILVADAQSWGQFYFDCASGLAETCDWVPLWLPGIASYAEDDGSGSSLDWSGKRTFLQDILEQIIRSNILDGERFTMQELVAGVDYHYYHRDPIDRRRLLFLALELPLLRDDLNAAVPGALLTVMESTINVLCSEDEGSKSAEAEYEAGCEDASTGHLSPSPDHRPARYAVSDTAVTLESPVAPANDFQGAMVWMRAAAAMVGQADIIGWQTLMARPPGPGSFFAGTGLRMDTDGEADDITAAVARPAWFAFQRMVRVMRDVTAATLLWPERLSRGDLKDGLAGATLDSSQLVWVVEFQGARRPSLLGTDLRRGTESNDGTWAYLVFIDGVPGLPADDATSTPTAAEVVFQSRSDPDVYRVPTGPTGCLTTLSGSDTFPTQLWSVDPIEHLPGIRPSSAHGGSALATTWTLRVGLGQWPLLLWSSMPLELRSVTVLGTV